MVYEKNKLSLLQYLHRNNNVVGYALRQRERLQILSGNQYMPVDGREVRLFGFECDVVGTRMHEFKLKRAGESLVEGVWRFESAGMHFCGVKFCGGAELLDAHRRYCKFLSGDFRE